MEIEFCERENVKEATQQANIITQLKQHGELERFEKNILSNNVFPWIELKFYMYVWSLKLYNLYNAY